VVQSTIHNFAAFVDFRRLLRVTLSVRIYGDFEEMPDGVKLATAEKALFDFAYLSGGRSRLFTSLPELSLPRGFRHRQLARWVKKIPSARSRTLTERKLESFLAKASSSR
jgi:hypothetical protein